MAMHTKCAKCAKNRSAIYESHERYLPSSDNRHVLKTATYLSVFRSLFDSDSVSVEATQLSNETLNVEVAVKLLASAKGKLFTCARYLEFCVTSS